MISAIFEFDDKSMKATLKVVGHASFDEIGKDIVCAAVSILVYAVAGVALNAFESGHMKWYPILRLENGDACIECACKDQLTYARICIASETSLEGFMALKENYPENIDVQIQ